MSGREGSQNLSEPFSQHMVKAVVPNVNVSVLAAKTGKHSKAKTPNSGVLINTQSMLFCKDFLGLVWAKYGLKKYSSQIS